MVKALLVFMMVFVAYFFHGVQGNAETLQGYKILSEVHYKVSLDIIYDLEPNKMDTADQVIVWINSGELRWTLDGSKPSMTNGFTLQAMQAFILRPEHAMQFKATKTTLNDTYLHVLYLDKLYIKE